MIGSFLLFFPRNQINAAGNQISQDLSFIETRRLLKWCSAWSLPYPNCRISQCVFRDDLAQLSHHMDKSHLKIRMGRWKVSNTTVLLMNVSCQNAAVRSKKTPWGTRSEYCEANQRRKP